MKNNDVMKSGTASLLNSKNQFFNGNILTFLAKNLET